MVLSFGGVLVCALASCAGSPKGPELEFSSRGALSEQSSHEVERPREEFPVELSVVQAVEEALRRNLSLLAQRAGLSVTDALLVGARVRPNPVLSLDVDHVNAAHLSKGDLTEAAARVDVPIVLGGKRDLRIEVAEKDRTLAELQVEDAVRRLRQEVSSACVDVIQAKANLVLAQDNLKTYEDLVRINDRRVQAGAIAAAELQRSKVFMLQFRSSVRRGELELAGARTKLKVLLGRRSDQPEVDLRDELGIPTSPQGVELPALHQRALAERPDLRALELGRLRAESDLRLQIANGVIDLAAGAEYRWNADEPSERLVGFFLTIPLPFFNQNAGEIARARAQREVTLRQAEALRAEIYGDVRSATEEFVSARGLVQSIEGELLRTAREVRDAEHQRYQNGAASFLEFLDAQRAFNDVRQSLNDAQATYRRAVIRLHAAVGSEVIS
ncbi:MAG: TolC family protein [Planctomycetaceae bacterium]|nr:TolC family protein [Planctomycetaceae bacterium]